MPKNKDDKNRYLNNKKYIFAYFPGTSLMHRLNPLSKLLFLILLTVLTLFVSSILFLTTIFVCVLLLAILSQISLKNLIHKLRFMVIAMLVSVILNIFFNAIPEENATVLFYLFGLKFLPIRKLAALDPFRAIKIERLIRLPGKGIPKERYGLVGLVAIDRSVMVRNKKVR